MRAIQCACWLSKPAPALGYADRWQSKDRDAAQPPRGSRTEGGSPMRFESAISESPRTLKHTFAATTVAVAVESVRRVLRERRRQ